jgi:hypothetical protein
LALHIGFALDVALTRRVGMGLDLRYFSLPSAPAVLPVYLQAGVFVGVRL